MSIFNESDSESDNFSQLQDSPYGDSSISCNYYSEEEFITDHSKNKGFSCLSLNIQSLSSKFQELNELVEGFGQNSYCFDVLILQELWRINDSDVLSIDGYQDIIFKSRTSAQGRGVGFNIKQGITFRIIEPLSSNSVREKYKTSGFLNHM